MADAKSTILAELIFLSQRPTNGPSIAPNPKTASTIAIPEKAFRVEFLSADTPATHSKKSSPVIALAILINRDRRGDAGPETNKSLTKSFTGKREPVARYSSSSISRIGVAYKLSTCKTS